MQTEKDLTTSLSKKNKKIKNIKSFILEFQNRESIYCSGAANFTTQCDLTRTLTK